jgi:hypothetical protein
MLPALLVKGDRMARGKSSSRNPAGGSGITRTVIAAAVSASVVFGGPQALGRTQKPPLYGQHWMAVTGKPIAASAGAQIFARGGNAVDAACAMLAATATAWTTLSWGGETQALIFNPNTGKVIAINGLGVAPTGATPELFHRMGLEYPPEYGPLAAVTPGTPGGIMTMLAEYGTKSLGEVLAPAIEMADGFPMDLALSNTIEHYKEQLKQWPDSRRVMLPHLGSAHEGPAPGEMFRQPDLAATLRKLVEAERDALAAGKDRKAAIYAAYDRFYRGDIARDLVHAVRDLGGLFTTADLANWQVKIEEPVHTTYKGIEVYKLQPWVQGPLPPHDLPGDESCLRRPRLLLRRSELLPGAADRRAPLQGICARARQARTPGRERSRHPPGRSVSLPGRQEPVPEVPRGLALEDAGAAAGVDGGIRPHVPPRHHQRAGGG